MHYRLVLTWYDSLISLLALLYSTDSALQNLSDLRKWRMLHWHINVWKWRIWRQLSNILVQLKIGMHRRQHLGWFLQFFLFFFHIHFSSCICIIIWIYLKPLGLLWPVWFEEWPPLGYPNMAISTCFYGLTLLSVLSEMWWIHSQTKLDLEWSYILQTKLGKVGGDTILRIWSVLYSIIS